MNDYLDSSWHYEQHDEPPEDYEERRDTCDGCGLYFYVSDLTRINGQMVCEACQFEGEEP